MSKTHATEYIVVEGARENNLKDISVSIPRNTLTVITGLSGSGKSSLAFNTIFAEGQRRYIETFSPYARQFLGGIERPDVDKITGLSPVISIEQKTTNKNPRSTVGTTTEIYDFLRLLFARSADAYSYVTGNKMVKYTAKQIEEYILTKYADKKIYLLAPIIKGRKGHYKELFEQIRKKGYLNVRIDGKIQEITFGLKLDRYKIHNIEIVVDKLAVNNQDESRIKKSIDLALKLGKGSVGVSEFGTTQYIQLSKSLMCPESGISYQEPAPHNFSFNSPHGACPRCAGLGSIHIIDSEKLVPDPSLSLRDGAIELIGKYKKNLLFCQLEAIGQRYGFTLDTPFNEIPEAGKSIILDGSDEMFSMNNTPLGVTSNYFLNFEGVIAFIENDKEEQTQDGFLKKTVCTECNGMRLKKESLFFKINEKNIAELTEMSISELQEWFEDLPAHLSTKQLTISKEIIKEIDNRLQFLLEVGLHYLSLSRNSQTLSGGESQRIRLATQIGSRLVNVLYILDEPSIGLHQRDNVKLIAALKKLRDAGNSIIVVEHDKDMMLEADYIVDIGPGAGKLGGQIEASCTPAELLKLNTGTANFLNGTESIPVQINHRQGNGKSIQLTGATGNNLKNISVQIPLGKFICITGVSGSGKSSLINGTLQPILSAYFYNSHKKPLPYSEIIGIDNVNKIIEVDQSPLGRTPRSNPATYTNVFSDIRKLFEILPEAKVRGYKAGRFSFNVKGGRCETCKGAGVKTIEMNFLPDVYVTCDSCGGKRYNRETLEIRFKGKSISDILNLTINQACDFFENIPSISSKLIAIRDVGLGYITLGQPATTLSGGEAQRIKLASELVKKDTGNTIYLLDEPSTGLHFQDIKTLLGILNKIVDKGNTVVIIEHNLDIIKSADHIIDFGPEGGTGGGTIVAEGTPQQIAKNKKSYTGHFLKLELT